MTKHGTRSKYNSGCKCRPCLIANRIYTREYKRRRRVSAYTAIDPEQIEYEQRILDSVEEDNTERTA